jgi:hypothetical protein
MVLAALMSFLYPEQLSSELFLQCILNITKYDKM